VEREGLGAANPEGVTKESLADFDESSLSREEESPFLCKGGSHNYVELIFDFISNTYCK
jgi:hypothetical protein